ncbi:MAG: hypothetical protein ACI4DS_08230 [Eubacterium sp.]
MKSRILAIIGIIALISLYIVTLIFAIFYKKGFQEMFTVSIYCTIIIPVTIYAVNMINKVVAKANAKATDKSEIDNDNREK